MCQKNLHFCRRFPFIKSCADVNVGKKHTSIRFSWQPKKFEKNSIAVVRGTKEKAEKASSSFSSELLFMLYGGEKRERSSILPTSTFITINRIVTKLRRAFNSFFLSFFCGSPFICSGLYFDSRTTNLPHCTPLLTDRKKRRRDEENRADE